jgi:hypothetical protein
MEVTRPMSEGFESVADALEDAVGPAGGAVLQRAVREARGQPAYPSPSDYVAAVTATDGAVAIEVDSPDTQIVRLDDPDDRLFAVSGEDRQTGLRPPIVTAMIDEHGADLVLYEAVAQTFADVDADAQPVRPPFDQEAA